MRILVTAAHGGVSPGAVPIGGGAAVIGQLTAYWAARGVPTTLLGLGDAEPAPGLDYQRVPVSWPSGRGPADLVNLNEVDYARLCRDFEQRATEAILARPDRDDVVVVANDLSEGPDFARLAAAGIPVVTLWHVDVVDYFCRFYLGGLDPALASAAWRAARGGVAALPDMLHLVFAKQAAALAHSARHIVPSSAMRRIIARCTPGAEQRVEVVPWGAWSHHADEEDVALAAAELRREGGLAIGDTLLVTLSRLSPEKGIERALESLALGERLGQMPNGAHLWIGGQAAYMMGQRYRRRLERLAGELDRVRVRFLGHVSGARKQALWRLADVYVFPSRHESYGLTLAEALSAGVPVVSTEHYSARDLVPREAGIIVPNEPAAAVPGELWRALRPLLVDPARRARMADAARRAAARLDFDRAAARVTELLASVHRTRGA
ncbi:MAG: glycosyltransferase family 4 protein [Armatimonadetes bacterium]|nr:glycosyltransferase family 4 protein [Armatimonadota bacterium]